MTVTITIKHCFVIEGTGKEADNATRFIIDKGLRMVSKTYSLGGNQFTIEAEKSTATETILSTNP